MTESLQQALRPETLAAELARAGLRDRPDVPPRLLRAWPGGRDRLVALFADDGAGGPGGWWSLQAPSGVNGADPRKPGRPGGERVFLSRTRSLVQRFPADVRLPGISAALDAAGARDALRSCAGLAIPTDGIPGVRVAGYKPLGRCVIEYRFPDLDESEGCFWGKCYRSGEDEAALSRFRALDALTSYAEGRGIHAARPCGRIARWGMLVWRHAPGVALGRLLSGATARRAVETAGETLALLHGSRLAWPAAHGPADELDTLARWVRIACLFRPERAASIGETEKRVQALAARAGPGDLRAAHRDFHDKQILVAGDRATLLDLDTACMAEPELDAGNFIAHLRLRSLQRSDEGIRELAGPFLEAYARGRGPLDPGRLQWYEAGSLLRLSCVYSFRPGCGRLSALLLAEAQILAGRSGEELKERR